ncbi:MAG: DDE-type integrase/transposase/recombinase, partial [Gammaproteobacteria bacterium]|nr:DDE-type integrase/transposase/recombinase [Gammaproteobacteria bacterium]
HAQSLHTLTKKNIAFEWTDSCQKAFEYFKQALCTAPVLKYPDFSREFRIYSDASEVALGGVLCQLNDDNFEQPISYFSRTLVSAERRYSNTEREILAVCDSLKFFRPYIYGGTVTCFTDHDAVIKLMRAENPSQRLAKWQFTLMGEVDWSVRYIQGDKNVVADCLSRIPNFSVGTDTAPLISVVTRAQTSRRNEEQIRHSAENSEDDENSEYNIDDNINFNDDNLDLDIDDLDSSGVQIDNKLVDDVISGQSEDSDLSEMIEYIRYSKLPDNKSRANLIVKRRPLYQLIDGILKHLDPHQKAELRLVVPLALRQRVLCALHDDAFAGHQGEYVTYDRMRKRFYWDGMYTDTHKYISSCDSCLRNKGGPYPHRVPMTLIPSGEPWDICGVDIAGPFPISANENRFILGFIDYKTRYAFTEALSETSAATIARVFLDKVICVVGPPRLLLSDRGSNFLSEILTEVCNLLQTRCCTTTAYHPQTNGKCERFWGSIKSMLKMYVDSDQQNWCEMLSLVTYSYNTGVRSSTSFSSYELLFGFPPHVPLDNLLIPPSHVHPISTPR